VKRVNRRKIARKIAKERIEILYRMAEERAMKGDLVLASRYVELMREISKKYNVRIPKEKKYHICKKCNSFLVPGKNATVRLKKGKVVIKCLRCGTYKRYPYK